MLDGTKVVELYPLTSALHVSLAFPPLTVTLLMTYKTSITLSNECCRSLTFYETDTVLLPTLSYSLEPCKIFPIL